MKNIMVWYSKPTVLQIIIIIMSCIYIFNIFYRNYKYHAKLSIIKEENKVMIDSLRSIHERDSATIVRLYQYLEEGANNIQPIYYTGRSGVFKLSFEKVENQE